MSAATLLDELLAGFAPAAVDAWSGPTPANSANPANCKHPCGVPVHLDTCEDLRKPANLNPETLAIDANSRRFAAVRNPTNSPESQQPRGFSHDSQNSQGVPDPKASDPDLSAVAWTDEDIARFNDRRARLLRWGWAETEAEALADKLVRRDRDDDPRVSCADCGHFRPWRCANHRRAGLDTADAGRGLVGLLQRCPGFELSR